MQCNLNEKSSYVWLGLSETINIKTRGKIDTKGKKTPLMDWIDPQYGHQFVI